MTANGCIILRATLLYIYRFHFIISYAHVQHITVDGNRDEHGCFQVQVLIYS